MAKAIRIKVSPFGAGDAALVVPGLAEGVFVGCEGSGVDDAISSRVKHISTIAGSALALRIPGVARVSNCGADLLGVEVKSGRTGEAVLVAVPSETARIDLLLCSDDFTGTVVERISLIAGLADSLCLVEYAALR